MSEAQDKLHELNISLECDPDGQVHLLANAVERALLGKELADEWDWSGW